jgi:hypothetical protein
MGNTAPIAPLQTDHFSSNDRFTLILLRDLRSAIHAW